MYTLQVRVHRIHKINNIAMHKVLTHELYFCSTDCRNAVERLYSSELWWAWWAAHMKFTSEGRNQSTGSHYNDVIMGLIAFQITSLTIVYSIVYSDADQRKHQSSASLAFVRGIHRGPVNAGNSPGTDEFTAQMASYAENISIWWRHHENQFHRLTPGKCGCSLCV